MRTSCSPRQDAKKFLDRVAPEHPKVVEDLVPKLLPLAAVQRVLQNLLRERVSIRDAVTILEALGEAAATTRNPVLLTEYVRQALRRDRREALSECRMAICRHICSTRRSSKWWNPPCSTASRTATSRWRRRRFATWCSELRRSRQSRNTVVAISSSGARYFLRQMVEPSLRNLFFISHNEVPMEVKIISLGSHPIAMPVNRKAPAFM